MGKSLTDLYKEFALKNNYISKNEIKEGINLEKVIASAIIDSFKNNQTHTLTGFGFLKKSNKMINNIMQKLIDFVPDSDLNQKFSRRFISNQRNKTAKSGEKKKMALLILLLILVILGLGFSAFFFRSNIGDFITGIQNNIKNSQNKQITDNSSDLTTDSQIVLNKDNTADIKVEKIDYKEKDVQANEDKSIIIKTKAVNDTNLKKGESTSEVVEIDGKLYDKNVYIINDGDTLWYIADKFLFDPFKWPNIHKDNPYILNPNLIFPNYKLIIYKLKK